MAKTIAQLRTEAQTIRDASAVGENTATRVGGAIEDVVDYLDEIGGTFASGEAVADVTIYQADTDIDTLDRKKAVPSAEVIEGQGERTKTRSTASSARVYIYATDFGMTYFQKSTQLKFLLGGAATRATLYAYKADGTSTNLGYIYNGTEITKTVASDNISSYYAYLSGTGKSLTVTMPPTEGIRGAVETLQTDMTNIDGRMTEIESMLEDQTVTLSRTIDMSSSTRRIEITKNQGNFDEGDTISVHLGDGLNSYYARLYYYYTDGTYTVIQTATKQNWDDLYISAPSGKTFQKLRFVFLSLTGSTDPTINVDVIRSASIYQTLDEMREDISAAVPTDVKIVVLGDSYSQMGKWINALKSIVSIAQLNNLGVGGANLKDVYSSRITYPYTDRPYQTKVMPNGNEGNYNVINSQLEWLKRLAHGQCRGVYYEISFTTATADGSIALAIGETTYNVAVTNGQTASVIAANVAALTIPDYVLIHPTGKSYVTIEAQSASDTEMGSITASGTTATMSKIRSAETPIYQDGDYPDFVIIEAGKNDTPDTDAEVSAYMDDVLTLQSGYIKEVGGTARQGSCYVPTSKDTVKRTQFCGELSFLVREIRELFPKSLMIVVGPSSLKSATQGVTNEIKKDEQMHIACRYLQIPYVSWIDDGIINRVTNYAGGDGTQENPWVVNNATWETSDMLHPNDRGGFKLALAVAQKIRELISYRTLIKDY